MKTIAAITVTAAALALGTGVAHADRGADDAATICSALSTLNGNPSHDVTMLTTLASMYASYSGVSLETAGFSIGQTAHDHCPQYWPKIQTALSYAGM